RAAFPRDEEAVVLTPGPPRPMAQRTGIIQRIHLMQRDRVTRKGRRGEHAIPAFIQNVHGPFLTCHRASTNQPLLSFHCASAAKPASVAIAGRSFSRYLHEHSM